jgi:uncharacterized protein (DUF362 family)
MQRLLSWLVVATACATFDLSAQSTNTPPPKTRVVCVKDTGAVRGDIVDAARVRAMVQAGIQTLTSQKNLAAAWGQFASSNDVVGIKINTQAAPLQNTRREVVDAIIEGLRAAGVASTNIIVWDRDPAKLAAADFKNARAVIGDTGWDKNTFCNNKLAGKLIWGDLAFGSGDELSNLSHFPNLLNRITKLINVPVLMDHETCGLTGSLYNLSLGMVDNARRFEQMGQRGDPYIAEIASLPPVREKLVLTIMDALVAGYAGGPSYKARFSWPASSLYFSRDPVAVDAVCLELIEAKRKQAQVPPAGARASHIQTAARAGTGVADLAQIELLEIAPGSSN